MSAPEAPSPLEAEATPVGEQTLVPGVRPVALMERLQIRMNVPLEPRKPQKPCHVGLFDEERRRQLPLF